MATLIAALRTTPLALVILVASCAGSSSGASDAATGAVAPQSIEAGDVRLDALAPQELPPGRCGLFAWAQTPVQPILALVAYSNPAEARVRIDGRERVLPRTAVDGQSIHGQFETQTFAERGLAITVDVTFDTARQLRDGAAIERGVLRIVDREGWETIVPIGGMAACVAN